MNQRVLQYNYTLNLPLILCFVLILGIPGQRGEKGEKVRRFILLFVKEIKIRKKNENVYSVSMSKFQQI